MDDVTERIPEIIEIRDPEINVESIMARIRENIRQRKKTHPELFDLGLATFPVGEPSPDDVTDAGALTFNLRQALITADEIGVMMSPVKSPLPVIGPLWAAFKRQMHGLVLYYVNTLAGKQIKFNRHVAHVLQRIVGQGAAEEIVALRQEIKVLRARIEQLEQATSTDQTGT
ncbi:MAG: hypothetical protein JSV36_16245 [Anaerolineae bacterium]|nr:MAG: hypothetical protein JSV36_16245 [Anaerolineae bacterium]